MIRFLPLLGTGLITGAVLSAAAPVLAGTQYEARFAMHAQPHSLSGVCAASPNASNVPCSSYAVTTAVLTGYDVYIVIGQGTSDGFTGATFGIDYDGTGGQGVDVLLWYNCTNGLEFPSAGWPQAGQGNVVTWSTCQNQVINPDGVHAVIGALYVYAHGEDVLEVTPHRLLTGGDALEVADCTGSETDLLAVVAPPLVGLLTGSVHFGGTAHGYTPCGVLPVEPMTWGRIKAGF